MLQQNINVSFVCKRRRQKIRLLSVTDRSKPSADSTTNTNCRTCFSHQYCDITYRRNVLNKMSDQDNCSVRQKYWSFGMPLRAPAKGTSSQALPLPKLSTYKLKYSKCTGDCKGHSMTPVNLELKSHRILQGPVRVRCPYAVWYTKQYWMNQHAQTLKTGNFVLNT